MKYISKESKYITEFETAIKKHKSTTELYNISVKINKERDRKITSAFLNELEGAICTNIENLPQDIYLQTSGMTGLQIAKYLYKMIKQSKGKKFKGIDLQKGYEYWITVLFEKMLLVNPKAKDYDANSISSWIIKQLYTHANKYQTVAYVKSLRKIWLYGGLGKEYKQDVKEALQSYGEDINNYGIFKQKKSCSTLT